MDHLGIPNRLYNISVVDLVCLTCPWQSMAKIILKEFAKSVSDVVKSCCHS